MSDLRIPSHLILTQKQKEQLCSLPVSKFTDIKWESQTHAVSFLKEHGLILIETRQEHKWKVRYSNKSKGICLLQCCCGSDMSLKSKTNIRKSNQTYKFVGCLAFARIKKNKDKYTNIFGYLSHLEDCQLNKVKAIKTGEMWKSLPNELKNSFIIYANNERLLKTFGSLAHHQLIVSSKIDELKIIFDDHCFYDRCAQEN
ncbi:hypothetical protein C1645_876147, partial [Glomus cerebriforme]